MSKDGNQAVIPPGWVVSGISEENTIWGKGVSLVIYQIPWVRKVSWKNSDQFENLKKNYNQLVWCPVKMLDVDGTLNGENFIERFGRRNYRNDEFSDYKFNELSLSLLEQFRSVKKYGGFYISRYNISKSESGKPQSVKGVMPWINININETKKVAANFENNEVLKSHLTYGAEYDSVLAWFIKSGAKTLEQITKDSTEWGNFFSSRNFPGKVVETGSSEEWCANNIYDFAGNVSEWTQEKFNRATEVIRGGYVGDGYLYPVASRRTAEFCRFNSTGFRIALYIE